MRLLNILVGLVLLLLSANKIFSYSSFSISDFLLGVILIVWGVIIILSSIVSRSTTSFRSGGSTETTSTNLNGKGIFLGILSIFIGISNIGLFGLGFLSTIGTAILGVFFLISK
ncbi:MAG: hypothetical protein AABX50_02590 [Nanoarchaeota archaeon]